MRALRSANDRLSRQWSKVGTQFLPFADIVTAELTIGRLLRLSLFQVTVGMAAALLIGTLNRVMIVELGLSASLVAAMVSAPLVFAPMRAVIGHRSDNHRSATPQPMTRHPSAEKTQRAPAGSARVLCRRRYGPMPARPTSCNRVIFFR